jgi:hypothetical protein
VVDTVAHLRHHVANMRSPGRLLGALALLAALSARADVRAVLHAPYEGEVLRGGARATVSWSAPELPRFAEEWEAFLSVDGGKYYGYRITPHLDLDQRQFTFDVPNFETESARILIRAGDERREIEIELPQTFVIQQDHARALTIAPLQVVEEKRGEPARPGDRGVIEWIDGNRDGSALTPRSALQRPVTLTATSTLEEKSDPLELPGIRSNSAPPADATRLTATPTFRGTRAVATSRTGRDVLLAYRRLNI